MPLSALGFAAYYRLEDNLSSSMASAKKEPYGEERCDGFPDLRELSNSSLSTLVDDVSLPLGQWRGNLPCVCQDKNGCRLHNPDNVLMLPDSKEAKMSMKSRVIERVAERVRAKRGKLHESEQRYFRLSQKSEPILVDRPMDRSVVDPLDPVHPSIPYRLAWYHLNWVRNNMQLHESEMGKINELSCAQYGEKRPDLFHVAELYYHEQTFLLRQRVTVSLRAPPSDAVESKSTPILWPSDSWRFQLCSHMHVQLTRCSLVTRRGVLGATLSYSVRRNDGVNKNQNKRNWDSVYGTHRMAYVCVRCYMHTQVDVELVDGRRAQVTLTIDQNLGSGSTPFETNWLAALRGWDMEKKALLSLNSYERAKQMTAHMVLEAIKEKERKKLRRNWEEEAKGPRIE
ncbi:hypothetical protein F5Y18DRAFT_431270 [Xylariaceae sp. FL1019]|nr:hypothetical protein F5Y18DRAFT_431270 [Xylariaceae sp. FL1019]